MVSLNHCRRVHQDGRVTPATVPSAPAGSRPAEDPRDRLGTARALLASLGWWEDGLSCLSVRAADGAVAFADDDVAGADADLHRAVHAARRDAACVLRLATPAAMAVSTRPGGLGHVNFYGAMLWGDVGTAPADGGTGAAVAALGERAHLLQPRRGFLAVGASVPHAFQRAWTLQRACEIQLASDAAAGADVAIAPAILARVPASRLQADGPGGVATLLFDALARRAGVAPSSSGDPP